MMNIAMRKAKDMLDNEMKSGVALCVLGPFSVIDTRSETYLAGN